MKWGKDRHRQGKGGKEGGREEGREGGSETGVGAGGGPVSTTGRRGRRACTGPCRPPPDHREDRTRRGREEEHPKTKLAWCGAYAVLGACHPPPDARPPAAPAPPPSAPPPGHSHVSSAHPAAVNQPPAQVPPLDAVVIRGTWLAAKERRDVTKDVTGRMTAGT